MDFEVEQQMAASLASVEAALLDPAFIEASRDLPKLGGSELLDHRRDDEVVRLRIQRRFTGSLPSVVTRIVNPDRLTWVEEVTYQLDEHRGRHEIRPDHYADRLSATYTTLVGPHDGGTRRTARGSLSVRAPLGRRRVEEAIVSGLREYAAAEASLLDRWIAARGEPGGAAGGTDDRS